MWLRLSLLSLIVACAAPEPECLEEERLVWVDGSPQCEVGCFAIDTGGASDTCPEGLSCTGTGSSCDGCKDLVAFCE